MDIDVRLQYHSPDRVWVAVFMRDGKEWFLDGALVGMESSPDQAVADLLELAAWAVIHGENALTDGPISDDDRRWLFKLLDQPAMTPDNSMYIAMREAGLT